MENKKVTATDQMRFIDGYFRIDTLPPKYDIITVGNITICQSVISQC